ncbi:MAG: hypothetical protein V2A56_13735 [bacterium]
MIDLPTPGDSPAKKFDRSLLDEATERHLPHYIAILHLEPDILSDSDNFETWAVRCGSEVRRTDDGGAVVRRGGEGGFIFISPDQYRQIEAELVFLLRGEEMQ